MLNKKEIKMLHARMKREAYSVAAQCNYRIEVQIKNSDSSFTSHQPGTKTFLIVCAKNIAAAIATTKEEEVLLLWGFFWHELGHVMFTDFSPMGKCQALIAKTKEEINKSIKALVPAIKGQYVYDDSVMSADEIKARDTLAENITDYLVAVNLPVMFNSYEDASIENSTYAYKHDTYAPLIFTRDKINEGEVRKIREDYREGIGNVQTSLAGTDISDSLIVDLITEVRHFATIKYRKPHWRASYLSNSGYTKYLSKFGMKKTDIKKIKDISLYARFNAKTSEDRLVASAEVLDILRPVFAEKAKLTAKWYIDGLMEAQNMSFDDLNNAMSGMGTQQEKAIKINMPSGGGMPQQPKYDFDCPDELQKELEEKKQEMQNEEESDDSSSSSSSSSESNESSSDSSDSSQSSSDSSQNNSGENSEESKNSSSENSSSGSDEKQGETGEDNSDSSQSSSDASNSESSSSASSEKDGEGNSEEEGAEESDDGTDEGKSGEGQEGDAEGSADSESASDASSDSSSDSEESEKMSLDDIIKEEEQAEKSSRASISKQFDKDMKRAMKEDFDQAVKSENTKKAGNGEGKAPKMKDGEVSGEGFLHLHAGEQVDYYPCSLFQEKDEEKDLNKIAFNFANPLKKLLMWQSNDRIFDNLRSGKVDTSHLYKSKTNLRCFTNKVEGKQKKARIAILMDLSGSMYGAKLKNAKNAAYVLAMACNRLKVPYTVIGHNVERVGHISLRHFVDFDNSRKRRAATKLFNAYADGCNRDGLAIFKTDSYLVENAKQNERLVTIVISDGAPADYGYGGEPAYEDIRNINNWFAQSYGVKTVGVGIGKDTEYVKDVYEHAVLVPNVEEMTDELLKVLGDILH